MAIPPQEQKQQRWQAVLFLVVVVLLTMIPRGSVRAVASRYIPRNQEANLAVGEKVGEKEDGMIKEHHDHL